MWRTSTAAIEGGWVVAAIREAGFRRDARSFSVMYIKISHFGSAANVRRVAEAAHPPIR
jgi:hypothetical protein